MKYYTVYRKDSAEILELNDARQFHAFVSKTQSWLRKRYKVVVQEYD